MTEGDVLAGAVFGLMAGSALTIFAQQVAGRLTRRAAAPLRRDTFAPREYQPERPPVLVPHDIRTGPYEPCAPLGRHPRLSWPFCVIVTYTSPQADQVADLHGFNAEEVVTLWSPGAEWKLAGKSKGEWAGAHLIRWPVDLALSAEEERALSVLLRGSYWSPMARRPRLPRPPLSRVI